MSILNERNRARYLVPMSVAALALLLFSAVPLVQAQSATTIIAVKTPNYAGYVGRVSFGNFTRVSGTWNLPTITCNLNDTKFQTLTIFMALQNYTGGQASAIRAFATCVPGFNSPAYTLQAQLSSDPNFVNMSLAVKAGDSLSATLAMNYATHTEAAHVLDITTNRTATRVGASVVDFTRAEWAIARNPGTDLAIFFQKITFSGCEVVHDLVLTPLSKLSQVAEVFMVDGSGFTMASPTVLSSSGTVFSVIFDRSS